MAHSQRVSAQAAVLSVLLAAVLFGTTGTAQALGPTSTTPLGVGAARLIVGGLALLLVLPVVGVRRSEAFALWRSPSGLIAGLCTALYQVSFFAGVERAGVAIGTLVAIGSGPVFAGVLAGRLLGDRPSRAWIGATALCLVGLALLALAGPGTPAVDLLGIALALVAGLGYAAYTVLAKMQLGAGHAPSAVVAAAFGLGGLILIPALVTQPVAWLAQPEGVALALYLGLATTTVAYLLFGRGLSVLQAGPVTTLVLAEPMVATILGTALLHEQLTIAGAVGTALIVVGILVQGVVTSRGRGREGEEALLPV
ncbi:MAG TPA: EamA family transporter [Candidatus Limnocylindrales bacterium]|nr:EamA family transporter [Candidatus Limnocylindrales bacterium]